MSGKSSKRPSQAPICALCNKPIEGQVTSALGKTYHAKCFICAKCKKPITGSLFQMHDDKPYCKEDYIKLFAPKCFACKHPIADKIINAMGQTWHEEHFLCAICRVPLAGQLFTEHEGKPLCQKCFLENVAPKCKGCGKPISDQILVALDANWHPNCFKCSRCGKQIVEDTFQTENDLPVCNDCARKYS